MRALLWLVGAGAKIAPTGFKNKYYQAPGYLGSRVLEWDQIPPCREQYEEHYDPSCCEVYPRKECCCEAMCCASLCSDRIDQQPHRLQLLLLCLGCLRVAYRVGFSYHTSCAELEVISDR